jgi:3-phosphoshikimate 1-carboxyvinyltransferase
MKVMSAKNISGEIRVPGDKSISHRAVMLGAIARGDTRIRNLLDCDDCANTIKAFRAMGVDIRDDGPDTVVKGCGLSGLRQPKSDISIGESGTSMRLLAGLVAGQRVDVTLTGSGQLLHRPMKRITEPLSLMGVDIKSSKDGFPPLKITGGAVSPINYKLPVASAQVKSAVLFAGLYAKGTTIVEEGTRSRDHTERMMKAFGADLDVSGLKIKLAGGKELSARHVDVPGDISSAAFFLAAATILKGSKIRISGVGINTTRMGAIDVLLRMGARIDLADKRGDFEPVADIIAESAATKGVTISKDEIPLLIDELPAIFVVAALSKGRTVIKGAQELRFKETDRIASMQNNLRAMGSRFDVEGDDIVIEGSGSLKGAGLKSFGDHRTCMASAIAALAAQGESAIDDIECVGKSFPEFFDVLELAVIR